VLCTVDNPSAYVIPGLSRGWCTPFSARLKDFGSRISCLLRPQNTGKLLSGRGSAPGPAAGAYSAPPCWWGCPFPKNPTPLSALREYLRPRAPGSKTPSTPLLFFRQLAHNCECVCPLVCQTSLQSDQNLRGPRVIQPTMRIARRCAPFPLPRALPVGQTDRRTRNRFSTLVACAVCIMNWRRRQNIFLQVINLQCAITDILQFLL